MLARTFNKEFKIVLKSFNLKPMLQRVKTAKSNKQIIYIYIYFYVVQHKQLVIAIRHHDPDWYLDILAYYYKRYNLNDFIDADTLTDCHYSQYNITLADGSVFFLD